MAEERARKLRSAGMTVRGGAFVLRGRDARKLNWRDPYHFALAMSWPRFVAALLVIDLSLNLIFAFLYLAQPGSVNNVRPGSLSDAFFFSLETPLMRDRVPIFGLTWTLMHPIDAESPLYDYDAENFSKFVSRLFLSIEARDPMLSAHVYDGKDYAPEEILFGHRYADAVAMDEQGRTIADLSRVGWTEEEDAQEESD